MAQPTQEENEATITLEYRPPTPNRSEDPISFVAQRTSSIRGPYAWGPPLDVPRRHSHHHRRHSNEVNQEGGSPGSPGPDGSARLSANDHSPASAGSESSWRHSLEDGGPSIFTSVDRGYTAAEEMHGRTPVDVDDRSTSELLAGAGLHSSLVPLDDLIRSALQPYPGAERHTNKQWLPTDRLIQLVNESQVSQELSRAFADKSKTPEELAYYTRKVCGHIIYQDRAGQTLKASCRSIFAILSMTGQVRDAPAFLDAELTDRDLPLKCDSSRRTFQSSADTSKTLRMQSWTAKDFDMLDIYQVYMISPFFQLNTNDVPFYNLDPAIILPFIEDNSKDRRLVGHHGTVWRVKIHPAHHNFPRENADGQENPYFAVKQLTNHDRDGTNFRVEVGAWTKSAGAGGHPHLVRLLATWHQADSWYLLFPWAKGNLRDYWDSHPDPERSLGLVKWIAEQCFGIAEGLKGIHRRDSDEAKFQTWGIHGDIKPENILWFSNRQDGRQSLVICDFGFTRFHSKETRSKARPAGTSPTYRAPEYDTQETISRAYDIWTLACVYLEFITWYMLGPKGVSVMFVHRRVKEDSPMMGELVQGDKFFNPVGLDGDPTNFGAIVKPCVLKWIRYLRSLNHCSQFFHHFLEFIEKDLLVVDPKVRGNCSSITRVLKRLLVKCESEGEFYGVRGVPKPMSIPLSPIENEPVRFRFSEEARERMAHGPYRVPSFPSGRHDPEDTWQSASTNAEQAAKEPSSIVAALTTRITASIRDAPPLARSPPSSRHFLGVSDRTPLLQASRHVPKLKSPANQASPRARSPLSTPPGNPRGLTAVQSDAVAAAAMAVGTPPGNVEARVEADSRDEDRISAVGTVASSGTQGDAASSDHRTKLADPDAGPGASTDEEEEFGLWGHVKKWVISLGDCWQFRAGSRG